MFCQKCGNKLGESAKFCNKCGNNVSVVVKQEITDTSRLTLRPASRGKRFLNLLIDYAGLMLFGFIAGLLLQVLGLYPIIESVNETVLGIFIITTYYLFFESTWQRTPGKWITKTKVVSKDGTKPNFTQILGRSFSRLIPFEAFSFLVGGNPIGWHDRFPGTLVVPRNYTETDVKNINFEKIKNRKSNNLVIIIIVVIGGIAVLGILASIVLVSLNTARTKGQDASIKGSISSVRAQAEIYFDLNNNSYSGMCSDGSILNLLRSAEKFQGITPFCNDSKDTYVTVAALSSGNYFCVDNYGKAIEVTNKPTYNTISCSNY